MARLSVDLNRDALHEIAVPSSFETDGPFEVRLRNHGEAIHVHLNLDDELSTVARLAESNHYVEPYGRRSIPLETRSVESPVTGRLKIVTAYGAKATYTTVTVSPPGTVSDHVMVDESLAVPHRPEPEPSTLRERLAVLLPSRTLLAVCLAVLVGIVLAIGALAESPAVVVGSFAVVVGVVVVLAVTRRA